MFLNQTDLYALRAMVQLASQEEEDILVSSRVLAEVTNIPNHYLNKVMRRLVAADLVLSQKGHGGGFQLAKSSEDITMFDILDAIDASALTNKCAFGWDVCDERKPCPMHNSWKELKESFFNWAENTSLAAVLEQAEQD